MLAVQKSMNANVMILLVQLNMTYLVIVLLVTNASLLHLQDLLTLYPAAAQCNTNNFVSVTGLYPF